MAGLSWWASVALAGLLAHYPLSGVQLIEGGLRVGDVHLRLPGGTALGSFKASSGQALGVDAQGGHLRESWRRLAEAPPAPARTVSATPAPPAPARAVSATPAPTTPAPSSSPLSGHMRRIPEHVNLTLPCTFNLILPCGPVLIGPDGRDVWTAFGNVSVPGTHDLVPHLQVFNHAFSQYTAMFVGFLASVYVLRLICCTSARNKCMKRITETMNGDIDEDDSDAEIDLDLKEKQRQERMTVDSPNFIAPANIYRLLAVCHPGVLGWTKWSVLAFKAFVCAYMQIYMPYKILHGILDEWEFNGVKSPLWFASEIWVFASMFAATASLCNIFQGKCAKSIVDGAGANFYILTHERPLPKAGAQPDRSSGVEPTSTGYQLITPLPKPKPSATTLRANEFFFCVLSSCCNIFMSLFLQIVMFMKVATFVGTVDHIAMVAVSLYFVFDLDDKVMETQPKLRPVYRQHVLAQTQEREKQPKWLLTMCGTFVGISRLMTPVGLGCIILLSWRSRLTGQVIGGDGIPSL